MAQPLLSRTQARSVDQALMAAGIPGVVLMENAGRGAAEVLARKAQALGLRRAAVLVGPGNNGGDGYVVARHLRVLCRKLELQVVSCADPATLKGDAAVMRDAWKAVGGAIARATEDPEEAAVLVTGRDLIVDALFGTGLDRPLTGAARALVKAAREVEPALAVALDVPSGLDADTGGPLGEDEAGVFSAHLTLTFAASKPGLHTGPGRRLAGEVTVVHLGAPLPVELLVTRTWLWRRAAVAPRPVDAHKGNGGHVLVVGGSAGRTGAALLGARGAHRAGAGLVTVASRAAESIDARVLETMSLALPPGPSRARELLTEGVLRADAVVLGPGLGHDEWAHAMADVVWARARGPVVADADALLAVAERALKNDGPRPASLVLTPHPLELARLLGASGGAAEIHRDRLQHARTAAKRFGAVVVLKGAGTVVATPDGDAYITPYAEPTLAVAGSGDVLAGAIAARLAERGQGSVETAVLEAVDAHGRAGELVRARRGAVRGALASELADALSQAMEEHLEAPEGG
ncbi:MAG: NAD(P)H-hydrate dehydratase [Deltaproteobacteria bacterium]|nr:NAD(P)H-hydrate dehydratase [Deltaproteobacteria bacterium]